MPPASSASGSSSANVACGSRKVTSLRGSGFGLFRSNNSQNASYPSDRAGSNGLEAVLRYGTGVMRRFGIRL